MAKQKTQDAPELRLGPRRRIATDDLHVVRLTWRQSFLDDLMRQYQNGQRALEYPASVAALRFIDMTKRRLAKGERLTLRAWSNPYSNTIAVWIEKR
jgi:hypothetical protein